MPPMAPAPTAAEPQVHTMPERFRTGNGGGSNMAGGSPKGSSSTKRLLIIFVVVLVIAGLGVAGLFVFQRLNKTTLNDNVTVINNHNNANLNVANVNDENANANGNENANLSTNVNTTPANINSNANTNTSTNTNTSVGTTGTPLPSSQDTDGDGLTDVEEGVYGTDITKPDTDGDTFIDGKQVRSDGSVIGEVYNGFNPSGTGKLEGSSLVKRQENASKEYNLLVPSAWTATTDSSGGMLITPNQQTEETFQIRINDNPSRLAPKDWYKSISPNSNVDNLTVISVNGLEALYTEDLSTIYFFKDTKVYSLQYLTGTMTQVNFRTTVDMMVQSFKVGAASS